MRLFELAEQFGADIADVRRYLNGIGCNVKRDTEEVTSLYLTQAMKELPALVAAKKEEKKAKDAERRLKDAKRRAADKKKRESERKLKEAEAKAAKKEEERRKKEEEKQRREQEKAENQARKVEEERLKLEAKKAAEAKKEAEKAEKVAKQKVTAAPPKPKAAPVVPPQSPTPSAIAPAPTSAPVAEVKQDTPPPAPVTPLPPKPTMDTPAVGTDETVLRAPAPSTPASDAAASVAPPAVPTPKSAPAAATPSSRKPAAKKPVPPPVAPAKKTKAIEMVPLERVKKSLSRVDEIKSSLEQAQTQTLTKRTRVEPVQPEVPKKPKAATNGVRNVEDLIHRPRLSASADLRQSLAERARTDERRALYTRLVRKRKHGLRAGQKPLQQQKTIMLSPFMTVRDLSQATGVKVGDIIGTLMRVGVMANINQVLDKAAIEQAASQLHLNVAFAESGQTLEQIAFSTEAAGEADAYEQVSRPPVVTFMGHVDHGKTSLLDAIRQENVVAGESGGITQHIGAYEAAGSFGRITFIDTPGHEAFTSMRARGARVTDIAVLVVAADDGLMPQSLEALDHAKAADVPVMVAINKIDLPGANADRVLAQLAERGLTPEEWGGDVICCKVSAITREGLDHLLEMITLQAEVLELTARTQGPAEGVVLEAVMDAAKGATVTVLVQQGTVRRGDALVCNTCFARARALLNYRGEQVEEAGPSMPVQVLGFSELPAPGSIIRVATSERHARELVEERRVEEQRQRIAHSQKMSLETFYQRMAAHAVKELLVIVKADTQGTTEALRGVIERLSTGDLRVNVLHTGVGDVNENDIMLASASNAVVIAFRVEIQEAARAVAKSEGVDVKFYDVIYHVSEELKRALIGMLEPTFKEVETGVAEVRAVFGLTAGTVAGCYVLSGTIQRNNRARVMRGDAEVFNGEIQSLRHVKDEVREIRAGFECGILLRDFKEIQEGDRIHAYKLEREMPELPGAHH